MQPFSHAFKESADRALENATQRRALGKVRLHFGAHSPTTRADIPASSAPRSESTPRRRASSSRWPRSSTISSSDS